MAIPLPAQLPARSSRQPGPLGSKVPAGGLGLPRPAPARGPYSALLPVGLAVPVLLPVPRWALTPPFHPYPARRPGGLFSVALSLGLPRPGVTRHRVFMESGLSSRRVAPPRGHPAIRASGQIRAGQGRVNGAGGKAALPGISPSAPVGTRSCGSSRLRRGGGAASRRAAHAARPAPFRLRGNWCRQS